MKKEIWIAAYSAAYVRQFMDHMAEGRGCPIEPDDMERHAEEAAAIADNAAEAYETYVEQTGRQFKDDRRHDG